MSVLHMFWMVDRAHPTPYLSKRETVSESDNIAGVGLLVTRAVLDDARSPRRFNRLTRDTHSSRSGSRPIVAMETMYTLIATLSCDQVCTDVQLLL
ncbi:hypothetical protein NJ7G_1960 [Natrinema sp. J7-2]|nr:hypothetical protein NJ7G_1960 [Natrinema sp. J7-2]